MTNKLILNLCITSFLIIFSFVSCLKDLRRLTTTIYPIDNQLNDKIFYRKIELESENDTYLSYNLSSISSDNNIAFTIHNSINGVKLNIECILSNSENEDDIIGQFNLN